MGFDRDDPTDPKTGLVKIKKIPEPKTKDRQDCYVADTLNPRKRKNNIYEAVLAPGCATLLPVIVSIDGTTSMRKTPLPLQEYLHKMFETLTLQGVDCPNIMVMCHDDELAIPPDAAFQMSDFEKNEVSLCRTVHEIDLPLCGGNNKGEAYHLSFYAAAHHTRFEAKEKGFFFIIGDEEPYYNAGDPSKFGTSPEIAKEIFGDVLEKEVPMLESVKKTVEKYHVFIIRPAHTNNGQTQKITKAWQKLLELAGENPDNVLEVADTIAVNPVIAFSICITRGGDLNKLETILKGQGVKHFCSTKAAVANLTAQKTPDGASKTPVCEAAKPAPKKTGAKKGS
jgi:hypothetical protein